MTELENTLSPQISVVICTFNRKRYLVECLDSLLAQTASPESFEVLVVDNNSTDGTAAVVEEYSARAGFALRYVKEERQGLSHARNRAIKEVKAELVGYVDDDARLCSEWVQEALGAMQANPDAMIACGPISRFCLSPIPEWFPPGYGTWALDASGPRPMQPPEYINGGNMVFRRHALVELGGFSGKLGMNGKRMAYGEETRICMKAYQRNWLQLYLPKLRIAHAVMEYKLSLLWLLRSSFSNGRSNPEIFDRRPQPLRCFLKVFPFLVRDAVKTVRNNRGPAKRMIYHALSGSVFQTGVAWRMLQIRFFEQTSDHGAQG